MVYDEKTRRCKADDGKCLVRKSDKTMVGTSMQLGADDDISDYKERKMTAKDKKIIEEFETRFSRMIITNIGEI